MRRCETPAHQVLVLVHPDLEIDLESRYGGELFGVLPADDREQVRDEAAVTEWLEQDLLAHVEKLAGLLLATRNAA